MGGDKHIVLRFYGTGLEKELGIDLQRPVAKSLFNFGV